MTPVTSTYHQLLHSSHLPRSVQWRSWLGIFQGEDAAEWVRQTSLQRQAYCDLLQKFTAAPINDDDDLQINNPLSQHQQSSWSQFFKSADLHSTIDLDLVRTHPSKPFFQLASTQSQMRNILFVWAQLHPNVSYRQGMNELLAPIVIIRSNDAENVDDSAPEDLRSLSDREFIEHDSFAMFEALMLNMSSLFTSEFPSDLENQQPPIVARSEYVQFNLLKQADFELYSYLSKISVQPQLYGLRWLRLLLAREFHLEDVVILWDAIFRSSFEDKADSIYPLPLVDYLCVAMLQFVREDLISGDHSTCIRRLLSYPPVEDISVLIVRAEHLLKGEVSSGIGSFVYVPSPVEAPREANQQLSEESSMPDPVKVTRMASGTSSNGEFGLSTENQQLGSKLEDLVSIMQREIRKGKSECDQSILLQCLAKIKLIKDVLIGNLSFDSVAEDIHPSSHPLV